MTHRQQINLYLPHLRPRVDYLSPANSAIGIGCLLLLSVLITVFSYLGVSGADEDLAEVQHRVDQLSAEVDAAKAALPKRDSGALDKRIAALKQDVNHRQSISRLVQAADFGNQMGFSEKLVSLASNSSSELALTAFGFANGGRQIMLEGNASRAEAVPVYVDKLQSSRAFTGSVFGRLDISRGEQEMQFSTRPVLRLNTADADG